MVNSKLPDISSMLIELRRYFHSYPEISRQEVKTSQKIISVLEEMGLTAQTFSHHNGVCATVNGNCPGPVIALRADMDALPITEENEAPYKSKINGVMHACGHDAHMAILLGVAYMLTRGSRDFAGSIKLIFQPAEEAAPLGGSQKLIEDGVLNGVSAIFGLHVWPDLPCGSIGIKKGAMMAASDRCTIKMIGKSAHAGEPHKGVDAIVMAADVIETVGHIFNRQLSPFETATFNIGTINGGERYNVVAQQVVLEGTVRTLNESVRKELPERIKRMVEGIAAGHGGMYEVSYNLGYPVLENSNEPYQIVVDTAEQMLGKDAVHIDVASSLAAEDFARYLKQVPGAFFWLGCVGKGDICSPLHNSRFDLDENALLVGAELLYHTALAATVFYQNNHTVNIKNMEEVERACLTRS